MGQYFYIVNVDKKEYINPALTPSGLKLWEICANGLGNIVLYLTSLTDDPSGTRPLNRGYHHEDLKEDNSNFDEIFWLPSKYDGHWANDRIATVGDYNEDTEPTWNTIKKHYRDITIDVIREYNQFMEDKSLMIGGDMVRFSPDMVVTAGGVINNPRE